MKLNTAQLIAHATPRIRNLFHLVRSPRLAMAIRHDEQATIEAEQQLDEPPRFQQQRLESEAERRFEFDRFQQRMRTRKATQEASTKFYYTEDGTPRFATPEACLNGAVSFEKAMSFQEWLALRRVTR